MGDQSKHVRVDNWGVFFLQRLQMFFNKTDFCDLTLQFDGNVQLKVHRLVMNACTDYFQVLEQTCDVVDDNIILMPPDLQADVILPIVNFMYTGTLEYHPTIYDRLVRTAELMNIPILIKLLEAHKAVPQQTAQAHKRSNLPLPQKQPKRTPNTQSNARNQLPTTLPGRKLPVWKRKTAPVARSTIVPRDRPVTVPSVENMGNGGNSGVGALVSAYKSLIEPVQLDNTPKPTRFEWPDGEDDKIKTETYMESSAFESLTSYSSTPLIKGEDADKIPIYDELRYTSPSSNQTAAVKRRPHNLHASPYTPRRPNQPIQQPTLSFEEDDSVDDDDQDPDDPDYHPDVILPTPVSMSGKRAAPTTVVPASGAKRVRFNEKENSKGKEIKAGPSREGDIDHSVLVAELLKKYPNLAKTNKNIKLKIMTKPDKAGIQGNTRALTGQSRASPVKVVVQGPNRQYLYKSPKGKQTVNVTNKKQVKVNALKKSENDGPWLCDKCEHPPDAYHLYYLYRKHMTDVHQEQFSPLMCKYCGKRTKSDRALSFHMHTVHGAALGNIIGTPFPQCDRCSFSALTPRRLARHKQTHRSGHMQCPQCKVGFNGPHALSTHQQITSHISPDCASSSSAVSYDCQYCTRHWQNSATLFVHIRTAHREDARKDGIVSIDEDPEEEEDEEEEDDLEEQEVMAVQHERTVSGPSVGDKVKIITDVKVSGVQNDNTVQMQMTNAGITTALGLVDIVVLDENQQYILQSSNGDLEQSEFILPQITGSFVHQGQQVITTSAGQVITTATQQTIQQHSNGSNQNKQSPSSANQTVGATTTDELVMVLTDHDYNDETSDSISQTTVDGQHHVQSNGNIVVLYSHPVQGAGEPEGRTHGESLLVQTAEGQVLEIRNGPPDLVVDHTSQQESIELIQREINSSSQQQRLIIQQNEEDSIEEQPLQDPDENLQQDNDHHEEESAEEDGFQDGDAKLAVSETQEDDGFHEETDEQEEQQVMLVVAVDEEESVEEEQNEQVDQVTSSEQLDEEQSAECIDEQDGQVVGEPYDGQDICGSQDGVGQQQERQEEESEAMDIDEQPETEEHQEAAQEDENETLQTSVNKSVDDPYTVKTVLPRGPNNQRHKSSELGTIQQEDAVGTPLSKESYAGEEEKGPEEAHTSERAKILEDGGGYSPEAMEVDSKVENKDGDQTEDLDESLAEHGRNVEEQLLDDDDKGNVANSTFEDENDDGIHDVPDITGEDGDVQEDNQQENITMANQEENSNIITIHDSSNEAEEQQLNDDTSRNDIGVGLGNKEPVTNLNGDVIKETTENLNLDQVEQNMEILHSTQDSACVNSNSLNETGTTKNTTIALLDEWEDTEDSSSQDKNCQTNVKTPNAVNKLINDDWDDDE